LKNYWKLYENIRGGKKKSWSSLVVWRRSAELKLIDSLAMGCRICCPCLNFANEKRIHNSHTPFQLGFWLWWHTENKLLLQKKKSRESENSDAFYTWVIDKFVCQVIKFWTFPWHWINCHLNCFLLVFIRLFCKVYPVVRHGTSLDVSLCLTFSNSYAQLEVFHKVMG